MLCLAILLRTVVTLLNVDYKMCFYIDDDYVISSTLLNPDEEVKILSPVHIRMTHICSFTIWVSGSLIPLSLFFKMKSYMKNIVALRNLSVLGNILSFIIIVFVVCYEVWMFKYIFVSYAASCAFVIQLVMIFPFYALITHSVHQVMFLIQYTRKEVFPRNESLEQFLLFSGFFNFIMFVHLICMAITVVFTGGISRSWSAEKYVIVPLGFVELLYRGYALYCYYGLYTIHKSISDSGKKNIFENAVEIEH